MKDIQDQLLGTGLGVRLYSVIEQGRIDQVLSTKPQDRRRLIEEAAGNHALQAEEAARRNEARGDEGQPPSDLRHHRGDRAQLRLVEAPGLARRPVQGEVRGAAGAPLRASRGRGTTGSPTPSRAPRGSATRSATPRPQAAAALARGESDLASSRLSDSEAGAGPRPAAGDRGLARSRDRARRRPARRQSPRRSPSSTRAWNRSSARDASSPSRRPTPPASCPNPTSGSSAPSPRRGAARSPARRATSARRRPWRPSPPSSATSRPRGRFPFPPRAIGSPRATPATRSTSTPRAWPLRWRGSRIREERFRATSPRASRSSPPRARKKRSSRSKRAAAELEIATWEMEIARLASSILEAETARDKARDALGSAEHRLTALQEIVRSREHHEAEARAALAAAGVAERGTFSRRLRPAPGWEGAVDALLGEDLDALLSSGDPARAVEASRALPAARLIRDDWTSTSPFEGPASPSGAGGWQTALSNYADLTPAEKAALPNAAFVETLQEALDLSRAYPSVTFATRRRELVRASLVRGAPHARGSFRAVHPRPRNPDARRRGREESRLPLGIRALRRGPEAVAVGPRIRSAGPAREAPAGRRPAVRLPRPVRRAQGGARQALPRERHPRHGNLGLRGTGRAASRPPRRPRRRGGAPLRFRNGSPLDRRGPCRDAARGALARHRGVRGARAPPHGSRGRGREAPVRRVGARQARRDVAARSRSGPPIPTRRGCASPPAARSFPPRRRPRARAAPRTSSSREENRARLEEAASVAAEASARVAAAEESTKALRAGLDAAREDRFAAEMEDTRVKSDLAHVEAQAKEEFGVAPSELPAPDDLRKRASPCSRRRRRSCQAAIERLGPVNVLAFEEFNEECAGAWSSSRPSETTSSSPSTISRIRSARSTRPRRPASRRRSRQINANFVAMFTRLFQGGAAQMRLLDENDLLESGVEIVAQPRRARGTSPSSSSPAERRR